MALLGLNTLSVRLSVVAVGLVTIWLIYKLARAWFKDEGVALLATGLATISSWHFFMSRAGYSQAMYGLMLLLAGTYMMLFSKKKAIGGILLGLTSYSYPGYFFFLPIYLIILAVVYGLKREMLIAGLILASAYIVFWGPNQLRAPGAVFFHGQESRIRFDWADKPAGERLAVGKNYDWGEQLLHRAEWGYGYETIMNYFEAWSPEFWLKKGRGFESNVPGFGNVLVYEPILVAWGIGVLLWQRKKQGVMLVLWLVAGPAASILTQGPASTKLLHMVVPIVILEAVGIKSLAGKLIKFKPKVVGWTLMGLGLATVITTNAFYYEAYFRHFPYNSGLHWQLGYLDVVDFVEQYPDKTVYWAARGDFAYIFVLFRLKYDPAKFQREVQRSNYLDKNIISVDKLGRYNFVDSIDWENLCADENAIYVAKTQDLTKPAGELPIDGYLKFPASYTWVYAITSEEKCSGKLEFDLPGKLF